MNNLAYDIYSVNSEKSGVSRLTLTDFRNYQFLRINVNKNIIVIYGENGSGKTNILEAISFLTPGRGIRNAKLADIKRISFNENNEYAPEKISTFNWAIASEVYLGNEIFNIGTAVEQSSREVFCNDDVENGNKCFERRIVKIDGNKVSSQAELGKYISAIWLTPQMDRLFRGGSQPRRSFLDRLVYAFDMEHAKRILNFEHFYKEWYRLLKDNIIDDIWLSGLEDNMATLGVAIAAARREQIARLNTFIENEPDGVFPNVRLELDGTIEKLLDTLPAIDVEDKYKQILRKQRKNILKNEAADGINRTDFKVFYKKKNMPAELCSTGEQKSLLISMILAQVKCQTLHKGFAPVLLLDEVVAHLDNEKKEALLDKIKELGAQAWITTTNPELFASLKKEAQFLKVENNQVIEAIT
ncbi:MAG: DNA replication/repair protein RecF [Alphaproteobacteria bacterium]|nr:DNA replication/repair protein RecF [Alphaproteobacteria bacterium]